MPKEPGWSSGQPVVGSRARRGLLPEEVVFTVQLALPGEALLREVGFALAALNTFDMPRAVQYVQQKAVEDGPLTAGTVHHHSRAPRRLRPPRLPWGPWALRASRSPPLWLSASLVSGPRPRRVRYGSTKTSQGQVLRLSPACRCTAPSVVEGGDGHSLMPRVAPRCWIQPRAGVLGGCWLRRWRAAFPVGGGAGTFPHFQAVPILIFVWPPPNSRILIQIW